MDNEICLKVIPMLVKYHDLNKSVTESIKSIEDFLEFGEKGMNYGPMISWNKVSNFLNELLEILED